jgi:soluble lytic murein transglycosylase
MLAPPNANFLNLSGTQELNESDILANKYHRANLALKAGFKSEACPAFEELSQVENFPLIEVSLIKAIESCDWTSDKLITTWKEVEVSPWIKEEYHQQSLKVAKNKGIRQWISRHYYELSFYPKRKSEKERYIKGALQIAEEEQLEELIETYNERLIKISPRFTVAPKNEELYSIGRDFERASQYKKAVETYESIIRNPEIELDVKIKSWKRINRALKNMRRRDLAYSSLQRYVKWIENNKDLFHDDYNKELVSAIITWARGAWTAGNTTKAKKILSSTLKKVRSKQQKAHIYYLLASIAKEQKKLSKAISLLNKGAPIAEGPMKEKILWEKGWIQYKRKKYKSSTTIFLALHNEFSDTSKYAYWSAKSLGREKKTPQSLELFEKTIEISPYGYYGLKARKKIGLKLEFNQDKIEIDDDNLYHWLMNLGEYDYTKEYLNQFIVKSSKSEKLSLLAKMSRAGNYYGTLRTYFNMGSDQREEIQKNYLSYIYPKPKLTSKYLNKNVDINLVYSIIRQESAFDKDARSFADAFGLMQIIPQRAKKLSKIHKIPFSKEEDLYDVYINTGLGSHYLDDLVTFFKRLPMAIGSYNAGESAMKRWLKVRYDGDIEVFIEDIPYRETKKYIKLVLRNLEIYKELPIQKDKLIY